MVAYLKDSTAARDKNPARKELQRRMWGRSGPGGTVTRGFSDLAAPSLSVWLSLRWFHSHFLASLGSLQLVVKWGSLAPDLQGYVTKTYVKKRESPFPRKESNDSAGPGVSQPFGLHEEGRAALQGKMRSVRRR